MWPLKLFVGDSGYANRKYLLVPLQNPATEAEQLYNESQIRTRNCIERLFGVWKRRFPILAYGLRYKPEFSSNIIVAAGVMHNVAIQNNEGVPPLPEEINEAQLNYLIEIGNIPPENPNDQDHVGNNDGLINHRRHLILNYFGHL